MTDNIKELEKMHNSICSKIKYYSKDNKFGNIKKLNENLKLIEEKIKQVNK